LLTPTQITISISGIYSYVLRPFEHDSNPSNSVVVGLYVAGLAFLSYKGWIDVKWTAMENATGSILANVTTQAIHTINNTASQFATHSSTIAASGLPITAGFGFVPGLMIGFKRG
jgi:uncharacterized membrane protein (Fun14 family)